MRREIGRTELLVIRDELTGIVARHAHGAMRDGDTRVALVHLDREQRAHDLDDKITGLDAQGASRPALELGE